jgi:radical SAM superfamily enzyme YgiQ (UPF0313 family)
MPHVALVAFSGLRVRESELAAIGMTLPGLASRANAVAQLPSLGMLTLAGMLPEDWTASYHEADGDLDGLLQSIVRERPNLVAVSALTASADDAYQFAKRLRGENIRTAFGGLHATACAEEAGQHFDAVCLGEGEFVWPAILRDAAGGRLEPRYEAVRTNAELCWPLPRFEMLRQPRSRWMVQTQRGCPLACEFCGASRLISRFREKPALRLRDELLAIKQLDENPTIELADDNTFAGPREPEPLLELFSESGVRYFTEVDWRVGERPELLRNLASSGCVQVLVGIESLVFRFPGMGAKDAELARVMAATDRIQDAGIAVNGCFIVGGDGETRKSLAELSKFVRSTSLADVQVTLSTPFPGTALRSRLAREGRLLDDRGWSNYTLFDVTFRPDRLSVSELETGYRELLGELFDASETGRRSAIRHEIWRRNPAMKALSCNSI